MAESYEMHTVSRITVGTVGEPGDRTFFLQGSHGAERVSLIIEKLQALALAQALSEMLEELENRYELPPHRAQRIPPGDLELEEPIEARFRVGQIGLGYDEGADRVVLMASELGGGLGDDEELEPIEGEVEMVRFWISRDQASALGRRAVAVAGQGRPICPLCEQPIDPDGHFCPRSNGHSSY